MNAPIVYLNGQFLPFADAALPLHDAGFVAGATVVDNARTFRHKLFRWSDHLTRFRHDCDACFVPLEATEAHLSAMAEELIAHNAKLLPGCGELQVVLFATPGPLGFYLGETHHGPPTLGMVTYPLPFGRYRKYFTEGVTLAFLENGASGSLLSPTVKHRSRMLWHVADHTARRLTGNPLALGMPLGPGEALTETSVANFLAVIDGTVVSPPPETVLAGISLQVVRELCDSLGLPFQDRPLDIKTLRQASEAMLCGTAFCLAGVNDGNLGQWPGPVFQKLLAAWSDRVGVDIASQFLSHG